MRLSKLLSWALPATFLLAAASCKPDLDETNFTGGQADLTHYVAFGDGFTAGVSNGGIYQVAQETSYPAIIAAQMNKAGAPSGFKQAFFAGNGTGYYMLTAPGVVDTLESAPNTIGAPFATSACYPFGPNNLLEKYTGGTASELQNLGVPNMRLGALTAPNIGNILSPPGNPPGLNPSLTANPYFERLMPDQNNPESYVQVAYSAKATFFTVWFGVDDMLNWALSGGTCGPRPIPTNNITGPVFSALLDTLAANGGKGVVGRIPKVIEFPYFKLVNNDDLIKKAKEVTNDTSAFVWHTLNNQVVKISASDIILYHAMPKIGVADANGNLHGFSQQNPLTNAEVLTPAEVGLLNGTAASFNLALPQLLVGKRKFPVVNVDDFITGIQAGYQFNGIDYSGNYSTGEFFSLDGLHFSARGNALIANKFIEAINSNYGAFIPQVNPGDFSPTQRP